ncbi:hypothetical protein GQ42DRAFT_25170 [Ramicandelaber brevisporus]|nr:hypothetical protein GQ42DRAFT_25170 [Ramicandelaber brevisporus]
MLHRVDITVAICDCIVCWIDAVSSPRAATTLRVCSCCSGTSTLVQRSSRATPPSLHCTPTAPSTWCSTTKECLRPTTTAMATTLEARSPSPILRSQTSSCTRVLLATVLHSPRRRHRSSTRSSMLSPPRQS